MATTIKDIARGLGVAPSTVTRALSDSGRIGGEMKQRVNDLALQLNYVPSSAARNMRSQSSNIVGFIVPNVENNDAATIAKEIADCCSSIGFQLVLALHGDSAESEHAHIRALVGARAAAVVMVPTERPLKESLDLLKRLPVIQVIRQVKGLMSSNFSFDDAAGLTRATEHLLALGHERIAYLGSSETLSTGRARLKGLRAALRGAGILATESLIRTTDHAGANAVPVFRELMEQEPTALILGGTRITAAIVDELSDMSVAIPKQLSLIGFGERSWSKWWGPGLTTIAMPCRDLAIAAGKHLVSRIDPASSEKAPRAVRTTSLLPGLNLRGSTSRCRN